MRLDKVGLVVAIVLYPLAVLGQAAGTIGVLDRGVLARAPEDLVWSASTLIGGFLGLALHVAFSWGEWRKLMNAKMSLFAYIYDDMPGFMTAWILATIGYFGLPILGSIPAVQNFLGFAPGMNFLSAVAVTYIASSLGYKIRSAFIRKAGGG
jgi:hypothetical protein